MTRTAIVSLLLAACGGSNNPSVDAPPGGDGPPPVDGPGSGSDAPPPGMVAVHVRSGFTGAPEANIRVLFANADGTLAGDRTTDATGTATSPLDAGYVTVIHRDNSDSRVFELITIEDVVAGDVLEFGPTPDRQKSGTATVTANLGGAEAFSVLTPCFRSLNPVFGTTETMDTFTDPACSTNVGVLATFFKNGVVGFSHLAGQTLAPNVPIAMPAQVAPLQTRFTLASMPDNVRERFGATERVATDAGTFVGDGTFQFVPPADFTTTFVRPPVGDTLTVNGTFERIDDTFGDQQYEVRFAAVNALTAPVASLLQRWIVAAFGVQQGGVPVGVAWFADATPDTATIAWTRVIYDGRAPDDTFRFVRWTILGPAPASAAGTNGVIAFPTLPDAFFQITANDTVEKAAFKLVGLDGTAGYGDVHATLGRDMFPILEAEQINSLLFVHGMADLFAYPGVTGIKLTVSP